MNTTSDEEADLAYFNEKLKRALSTNGPEVISRAQQQRDLIGDAVLVYRIVRLPREKRKYQIPTSLLVQTFVREIQHGMDRRRP